MKKSKKSNFNKKLNFYFILTFLLLLTFSTFYSFYAISLLKGIENIFRSFITIFITLIFGFFIYKSYIVYKKNNFKSIIKIVVIIILYSILLGFSSLLIDRTYGKIKGLSNHNLSYSSSMIALKETRVSKIEKLDNKKIGILEDTENIVGSVIPNSVIKEYNIKNQIVYYASFVELLDALLSKEVGYIFVPTNYNILFGNIETYENLEQTTKIIYTSSKTIKKTTIKGSISKPFTLLLMGVDSAKEGIKGSSFNGDSLNLITFNPETLNSTILSIPRDTYLPISCFKNQRKNKITHAAWYGQDCMIKTIENMVDINVDYYVKINFKGLVQIVDSLGGINVDVPYSFCEQNSERKWGDKTIYLEKGYKLINGEEALALSRNRKSNKDKCSPIWTNHDSNDFIRGQNQQLIIKGILEKLKDVKSIDTVNDIFDSVSNNFETNMSTNEILSLYNILKRVLNLKNNANVDLLFGIQKLYLSGYDLIINDYSLKDKQGTKLNLYNFVPYQGSIKDISTEMKTNLGLIKGEIVKSISFSALVPYNKMIVGKNDYTESKINLVPSFINKHEDEVKAWADRNNIKLIINKIEAKESTDFVGMVKKQTALPNMEVSLIGSNGFEVYVIEKEKVTPEEPTENIIEENLIIENSNSLE